MQKVTEAAIRDRKLTILFVDDEPMMLSAFRALFRKERTSWDMFFAHSAGEALDLMAAHEVDVLVSDMRMPAMDGASLLRSVHRKYPATCRVLLSGQANDDEISRALPLLHSYLLKPCQPASLRAVIERCRRVRQALPEIELRRLVGGLITLPSVEKTGYLVHAVSDPAASLDEKVRLITSEPALCAKLLQVANSPAFGDTTTVSVPTALQRLGSDVTRALLTSSALCESGAELVAIYDHSVRVAIRARELARDGEPDLAFVTGLFWDVGRMALLCSPEQIEVSHADETSRKVGANILRLWSMPDAVADAVDISPCQNALAQELRASVIQARCMV